LEEIVRVISKQSIADEDIDSRYISRIETQTSIAVIEVSADAQNRILIILGANASVKFEEKYLLSPKPPKVCLAQLETPIT